MPSEATDRQHLLLSQNSSSKYAPPKVTESLPCPRCDSTNTKFCYYNNYNLSQPRHFCKSCRRYWTQGGTLRNIPVGGGTRKNSKRTRTSSSSSSGAVHAALATTPANLSSTCSSSVTQEQRVAQPPNQVSFFPCGDPEMGLGMTTSDVNLNESSFNVPETAAGSYTSMLNMQIQGQNFHEHGAGFHDFGIGSGLDDLELGFGTTRSWEIPAGAAGYAGCTVGDSSGCNTWQLMNGGDDHQGGNGGVGEDCFVWPGLAISTPAAKGFK